MIVQGITLPNPQSAAGYVSFARDEIVPEPVTRSSPVRAVFQDKVLPDDEHELVRVVFARQRNNKHILAGVCIGAAAVIVLYLLFWIFVLPRI